MASFRDLVKVQERGKAKESKPKYGSTRTRTGEPGIKIPIADFKTYVTLCEKCDIEHLHIVSRDGKRSMCDNCGEVHVLPTRAAKTPLISLIKFKKPVAEIKIPIERLIIGI